MKHERARERTVLSLIFIFIFFFGRSVGSLVGWIGCLGCWSGLVWSGLVKLRDGVWSFSSFYRIMVS